THTLGETALDLALDDHRVDPDPAIVDCDEATHLDLGGPGVDVDDADVRATRVGQVRGGVHGLPVEPGIETLGKAVAVGPLGDLVDGRALLRIPLQVPAPLLPDEIVGGGFEYPGRDQTRLVAPPARRNRRGGAGHRGRAAPVGPETEGRSIGVAV